MSYSGPTGQLAMVVLWVMSSEVKNSNYVSFDRAHLSSRDADLYLQQQELP